MPKRRTFLKGAVLRAGGSLLAPMLRQIRAEADGVESVLPRFVFVMEGNGLDPRQVHPTGIPFRERTQRDIFESISLKGLQFPTALEPVLPYKDRITIVQGLSGRIAGGGHSNNFGALGVFDCQGGTANCGNAVDVTIDAALGKANPGIFPLINLGISEDPHDSIIYNSSCWRAGQKLPTLCRPDMAYETLFGSVAGGDRKVDFTAKQDLLEFLAGDIKRVESRLGGTDREKLQSCLAACESLRNRHSRLVEVRGRITDAAPVPDNKYKSPVETDRLDAHFELAAAALIARLTNVVTIASGVGDPYFNVKFYGLGINTSKHALGHGGRSVDLTSEQMIIQIRRFHFELIARLMKQLDSVPEGNGTMLDNTLIIYLSDAAETHHSCCWEWPFVLLGNTGRGLKTGGRCLIYPDYGKSGHRTINNLYTTLLYAAGSPQDHFGKSDPQLMDLDQSGPLSELLLDA